MRPRVERRDSASGLGQQPGPLAVGPNPETRVLDAQQLIELLGLTPLEPEGGHFLETWRSSARTEQGRALGTAIYYLLTPRTCSIMHRLPGDELFHFYLGDPVDVLVLRPDGSGELQRLGTDLEAGERPQLVVPGGTWQGARLVPGGRVAPDGHNLRAGLRIRGLRVLPARAADRPVAARSSGRSGPGSGATRPEIPESPLDG